MGLVEKLVIHLLVAAIFIFRSGIELRDIGVGRMVKLTTLVAEIRFGRFILYY